MRGILDALAILLAGLVLGLLVFHATQPAPAPTPTPYLLPTSTPSALLPPTATPAPTLSPTPAPTLAPEPAPEPAPAPPATPTSTPAPPARNGTTLTNEGPGVWYYRQYYSLAARHGDFDIVFLSAGVLLTLVNETHNATEFRVDVVIRNEADRNQSSPALNVTLKAPSPDLVERSTYYYRTYTPARAQNATVVLERRGVTNATTHQWFVFPAFPTDDAFLITIQSPRPNSTAPYASTYLYKRAE